MDPDNTVKNSQAISVGKANFVPILYKSIQNKLANLKIQSTLSSQAWFFNFGYFLEQNWDCIFTCMQSSTCQLTQINENKLYRIPLCLSIPAFTNLTTIYMTYCFIENIQALAFLNIENLQQLSLYNNNIVNSKALNKTFWPNLYMFELSANKIKQLNLSRLKMKKTLQLISHNLDWFQIPDEQAQEIILSEDVSFLCKLQAHEITQFSKHQAKPKIQQPKLTQCLALKYNWIL